MHQSDAPGLRLVQLLPPSVVCKSTLVSADVVAIAQPCVAETKLSVSMLAMLGAKALLISVHSCPPSLVPYRLVWFVPIVQPCLLSTKESEVVRLEVGAVLSHVLPPSVVV